jgi:hypothetical protein
MQIYISVFDYMTGFLNVLCASSINTFFPIFPVMLCVNCVIAHIYTPVLLRHLKFFVTCCVRALHIQSYVSFV